MASISASNKTVAGPANRADHRRVPGVIAEFLTQTVHVNIDRAIIWVPVKPANLVHDPFTSQDSPAIPHKKPEQIEFRCSQSEIVSIQKGRVRSPIQIERADLQRVLSSSMLAPRRSTAWIRATSSRGSNGLGK